MTVALNLKQRGTEHLNWRGQKKPKHSYPSTLPKCDRLWNSIVPVGFESIVTVCDWRKQEPVTSCTDGCQMCECTIRDVQKGLRFCLRLSFYVILSWLTCSWGEKKNIKAIQVSYINFCGSFCAQGMARKCMMPGLYFIALGKLINRIVSLMQLCVLIYTKVGGFAIFRNKRNKVLSGV